MSTAQEPVSLDQLGESYEIIGELAGRQDAQAYLGTRRSDHAAVLIAVARTPHDDEGNALSLLAADTNLLATIAHRNLLPIVEGRWVGTDAFAVISARINAPTLAELLAREELPFPRIAAILQEVNGLLEWARGQKIVHRAVTPDTLFVEQGSDRVLASFAISPIPFGRTSPIGVDARTIGSLAKAMLAQHQDLAERVVTDTDALLQLSHTSETVPDIPAYIAMIAMADALKRGEIEYASASNAIQEQQRIAREQLEAERKAHEHEMAEQRKEFEKQREEFQRELAKERKELAKEREGLARERAEHERDRERFASETTALAGRARLYEATEELPVVVPDDLEPVAAAADPTPPPPESPRPSRARGPQSPSPRTGDRAWWNVGIVAAAVVVVAAVSALAMRAGRQRLTNPAEAQAAQPAAVRLVDSAAGAVSSSARPQSIVPLPTMLPDSLMSAAALADSAAMREARRERAARRAAAARRDSISRGALSRPETAPRTDSVPTLVPARSDSITRRDSVAKSRTDSLPKRDTLPKDTLAKRDTTRLKRDTTRLR